jgi:hypothetical protein
MEDTYCTYFTDSLIDFVNGLLHGFCWTTNMAGTIMAVRIIGLILLELYPCAGGQLYLLNRLSTTANNLTNYSFRNFNLNTERMDYWRGIVRNFLTGSCMFAPLLQSSVQVFPPTRLEINRSLRRKIRILRYNTTG